MKMAINTFSQIHEVQKTNSGLSKNIGLGSVEVNSGPLGVHTYIWTAPDTAPKQEVDCSAEHSG